MSISERDAILREREAVKRAVTEVWDGGRGAKLPSCWEGSIKLAARLYPLPKVTRVRVVEDEDGDEWRWTVSMGLQVRLRGGEWENGGYHITTPRQIEAVRDVLANPWVEVEE